MPIQIEVGVELLLLQLMVLRCLCVSFSTMLLAFFDGRCLDGGAFPIPTDRPAWTAGHLKNEYGVLEC
jgi:hypothetical protein